MLPLASGDIVLVSDQDFPSNVFAWRQLEDKGVYLLLGWSPDENTPEG